MRKRKHHLVRWDKVCIPLASGGLGIRSMCNVNKAMLDKWLWRLGVDTQGLWCRILVEKYLVDSTGWVGSSTILEASGMWKSILSAKLEFDKHV